MNIYKCSTTGVKQFKQVEHLKHLNILKYSSVNHYQVLNQFKMTTIIFWLYHTDWLNSISLNGQVTFLKLVCR